MNRFFSFQVPRQPMPMGLSQCDECAMRAEALFSCLPDEVLDKAHGKIERFSLAPKAVLCQAGDPGKYVYSVRSGLLKQVQRAANGSPRIVGLLKRGDTAGLSSVVGIPLNVGIEALHQSEVCRIPVQTLRDLEQGVPELRAQILIRQQRNLEAANAIITHLSTGTAQGRVARCLLQTLSDANDDECQAICREDMAALTSVTVETVSRIVADFKRQGLLKEYRGLFTLNRAGLDLYARS